MSVIANLLDELSCARECKDTVTSKIEQAVPELVAELAIAEQNVITLEKQIKDKAKFVPVTQAHTLVGKLLQLVWTPGRVAWDSEALQNLAVEFGIPDEKLAECQVQGSGFWSIRKRGKK